MRAEEFSQLLHKRPLAPLRIHMTDGNTYDIVHPEQVLVLKSRIDIGIGGDPKTGVLDRVENCSRLHVVRVEELTSPHSPERN
jgi:hypothetical protein